VCVHILISYIVKIVNLADISKVFMDYFRARFANVLIINKKLFKWLGINGLARSWFWEVGGLTRPPLPKVTSFFSQFQIFRVTMCHNRPDDLSCPNPLITNKL
jgi:hypothetical protein